VLGEIFIHREKRAFLISPFYFTATTSRAWTTDPWWLLSGRRRRNPEDSDSIRAAPPLFQEGCMTDMFFP
jgi:hypothetical protein